MIPAIVCLRFCRLQTTPMVINPGILSQELHARQTAGLPCCLIKMTVQRRTSVLLLKAPY
ncbi:hypothetical protein EG68_12616 [Paragonimus skrjabini miyazakii]|uniref:Uncharacterized protein n=1 Tax=Paragonimus skrjabini miyazakii TaxID=59628 RepID=A0A8S9YGT4_9TREM|nr:hypothetical protein EG68_12616 [Paragonimus skrjabini miyazakii]